MPGCIESLLHCSGILASDTQHEHAQWRIAYLNQHVSVVSHPTVRVQARTKSGLHFGDDVIESVAISRREEDVLTMIASEGHVIERSGNM
jgi:hypothetical protein